MNEVPLLSVNRAASWLRERGIRPASRHAIYVAIAQKRLHVAAIDGKTVLIRRTELERYARLLAAPSVVGHFDCNR